MPNCIKRCPLSRVTRKTFAHTEFFSVLRSPFQQSGLGRYSASFLARRASMLLPVGGGWLAAVLALGFCTAASADDVLFENVRIFDGKSAALSAPSNVLVKGNVIERISTAPIAVAGALRIAGN